MIEALVGKAALCRVSQDVSNQPLVKITQADGTTVEKEQISYEEMRNATPFRREWNLAYFEHALEQAGYDRYGKEEMMNGHTGEMFEVPIFIAPVTYQALRHMVKYKRHARATGPYTVLQRQPVEGRSNDGGIRLGVHFAQVILIFMNC